MEDLQTAPILNGNNRDFSDLDMPEAENGQPEAAEATPQAENAEPIHQSAEPPADGATPEIGHRDEFGRFVIGNAGGGRPKGSTVSITAEIKKKLEEMSPYLTTAGQQRTYLQALIDTILEEAIKNKDSMMIAKLWAYIDGLPRNTIDLRSEVVLEKLTAEQKSELVKLLKNPDA